MNSLIKKLFKTLTSILVTFFLFTIIICISLYLYIGEGLEFTIDDSNSLISALPEELNIDFNPASTINLVANTEKIDVYILLEDLVINKNNKNFLKANNASLRTSLSYSNMIILGSKFFNTEKILFSLIGDVNVHLKKPILNIKDLKNIEGNEFGAKDEFFILSINADNGILYDGELEIGEFSLALKLHQSDSYSKIQNYSINLKSQENFPAYYIGRYFKQVASLYDKNESVFFDLNISDKEVSSSKNTSVLNGNLRIRDTKMDLVKFPVELKPEPIRNLSLDLNVINNIGQVNLLGSVTNPKMRLKLQKQPNLQIAGAIDFKEILEPYLDLTVNGTDIFFAKLANTNLNGITDLRVSISGKNVLNLSGELDIKKSNGFLVPLSNSTFETLHKVREEKNE
tara:strand:+ start:331 stop:1530 length:1200 start_codon:yes stop_codon:yes gene_type:complete